MKYFALIIALTGFFILTSCTQANTALPATPTAILLEVETVIPQTPSMSAAETAVPGSTSEEPEEPVVTADQPAEELAPTEVPAEETAVPSIRPIEITYFTPAQQEGPYYTVNKPADRDNDLVDFAGANGPPAGQILEFGGKIYDANGQPVEGLTVEIWQTDAAGVYLHPNDPDTNNRDPNFQFYGESVTGPDGRYSFRTILPGLYEPRPRHIHVKVKRDGQELLTTQFYFAGEIGLQGDDAALLITAVPGQDAAGNPILTGERDIILNQPLASP